MATNSIEEILPLKPISIPNVRDRTEAQRKVRFQKQKIGGYSMVNEEFVDNDSGLKYLHIPSPLMPLDLLNGYTIEREDITQAEEVIEKFAVWFRQLKWISKHRKQLMATEDRLLDTDFISRRHILTYIMTFPYERSNSMVLLATKYRGNIYLHYKKYEEKSFVHTLSKSEREMSWFSGHRFEQYLTSSDPNIPPDIRKPFEPNSTEYTAVVSARLQDNNDSNRNYHSVMYSFRTDCIQSQIRSESLQNFVDLKTTYEGTVNKPYRRLKWWADSYLKGVSAIYYGEKDHNYVVTDVKEVKVNSLPNDMMMFWSSNLCINFLNTFLSHVKEVVTIDDPNIVYQFECLPSDIFKNTITCSRHSATEDLRVVPEWYINEFWA